MNSVVRRLVERLLPWYDAAQERRRDVRTARIVRRSEVAQERAARVIAEYRQAEEGARQAGERVIDEVERR